MTSLPVHMEGRMGTTDPGAQQAIPCLIVLRIAPWPGSLLVLYLYCLNLKIEELFWGRTAFFSAADFPPSVLCCSLFSSGFSIILILLVF